MRTANRIAIAFATALISTVVLPARPAAQDLSAAAKEALAAEARAKRHAQDFDNNASTMVFYDRAGKRTGTLGERAVYGVTAISPDGSRVVAVKIDRLNESADLFVLDIATGRSTRLTKSLRTEFVMTPAWSPDGNRIAYVSIRKGREGIYVRAADGTGAEELVYRNTGAFLNLSDWSRDGRFLTFANSDMKGGTLYTLPLDGGPDRKATEIFRTDLQVLGPRFSPDGRFLSYTVIDKENRGEVFVRPAEPNTSDGPWQVSEGALGHAFWRRDGKELYYMARDRSMMVVDVSTLATFSVMKPRVLFRQQSPVPDRVTYVSADGERFIAIPPPRGPQLQQLTIVGRDGQTIQKVGEPGRYATPSFSPDGKRLLVTKNDIHSAQADLWTIDLATGTFTRITNDTFSRINPLWSPDGSYIYYSSFRNGDFPVYRTPSDGGGSEELVFRYTPGSGVLLADISSDGKYLMCDVGGYLIAVPLEGDPGSRKEIEILRDEFANGLGRLSPDGLFIAYRSDEAQAERSEIYVRPFDASTAQPGDQKWRLSKDGVNAMLHWRADGREVFWRGLNLDSNDLLVMSAAVTSTPTLRAAEPKLLFTLPGPLVTNLGNISRDGQRFVFAVNVPVIAPTREQ